MTTVIFQEWFFKFTATVKERPLLLLLDGHITHLDMATIQHAKQNNVTIIKFPPHTTDVLQPLDVSCFKSLKNEWSIKLTEWYRLNQRKLIRCEFSNLMCSIWAEGLRPENIKSGFKKTGIYPPDRTKYPIDRFELEKLQRYNKGERLQPLVLMDPNTLTQGSEQTGGGAGGTAHRPIITDSPSPSTSHKALPTPSVSPGPNTLPTPSVSPGSSILPTPSVSPGPSTLPTPSVVEPGTSPTSFEQLLLARIKKTDAPTISRRKIDVRAKVITSEEYAKEIEEKKKEEHEKKKMKPKKKNTPPATEGANDAVGISQRVQGTGLAAEGSEKEIEEKKKEEKQNKKKQQKRKRQASEDEDGDNIAMSDIVDDDSLKDVSLLECDDSFEEVISAEEIKVGDFLLAKFKGGKRNTVLYRYVVSVCEMFEDGELSVNALVSDGNKKTFKDKDDVSVIKKSDVIGKLPMPDIFMVGIRPRFLFKNNVDVYELKSY